MRNRWIMLSIAASLSSLFILAVSALPNATQNHQSSWQLVGQIGGPTQDVVVSGTLAYVAAGGAGLQVVSVLTPTAPVEIGAWDSPGYAEGVAVAGNTVYMADGPYGLWMVDVSDPAHPRQVGSAYDMNYAFEVAVSGNRAYIATMGLPMWIRTPIIPGYTDDLENIRGIGRFIRESLPTVQRWDLLAYTNLGQPKYHRLDLPYPLEKASLLTRPEMESVWQAAVELVPVAKWSGATR